MVEKIYSTDIDKIIKYFFLISGFMLMMVIGLRNISFDFFIWIYELKVSLKWAIWVGSFLLILIFLFQNKLIPDKAKWMCLAGLAYISLCWGLMCNFYNQIDIHLHDTKFVFPSNFFPLAIIACIWINDTMAYIVGSLIGKTPLSKVSPKKTWEGTIGGILLTIVVAVIYAGSNEISLFFFGFLSFVIAVTGTLGDLLESRLKRMANVKDSGSFMPGHGGFLDRFDSMLLATPAVWVFVQLFL